MELQSPGSIAQEWFESVPIIMYLSILSISVKWLWFTFNRHGCVIESKHYSTLYIAFCLSNNATGLTLIPSFKNQFIHSWHFSKKCYPLTCKHGLHDNVLKLHTGCSYLVDLIPHTHYCFWPLVVYSSLCWSSMACCCLLGQVYFLLPLRSYSHRNSCWPYSLVPSSLGRDIISTY